MIIAEYYLFLSAIIFGIGVSGILMHRQNILGILLSIELMLLAVNINFVSISSYNHDASGTIFSLMILTVAAAETAIGLAILVLYYRRRDTVVIDDVQGMRG
jgi:NADH-quinone oxidoreductase subunit K